MCIAVQSWLNVATVAEATCISAHIIVALVAAHRPVTSDMVDDQMPLIGIPSFIKSTGPTAERCTHYFVSVRATARAGSAELSDELDESADADIMLPLSTTLTRRTPSVCYHVTFSMALQFLVDLQPLLLRSLCPHLAEQSCYSQRGRVVLTALPSLSTLVLTGTLLKLFCKSMDIRALIPMSLLDSLQLHP